MVYTKYMIDLFRMIRRNVKREFGIRLQIDDQRNMDLLPMFYSRSEKRVTRSLIDEFMSLTNADYIRLSDDRRAFRGKVYRSQQQAVGDAIHYDNTSSESIDSHPSLVGRLPF